MSKHTQHTKVTVEDLLRLKRAERPTAEFWAGFERELRQKQLVALLEKRPWWQEIPHAFARRAYLPLGAMAALAMTVVTVRHYSVGEPLPVKQSFEASTPAAASSAIPAAADTAMTKAVDATMPVQEEAPLRVDDRTAVASNSIISEQLPERTSGLTPWGAPHTVDTPSTRTIAAEIANLEQTSPELVSAPLGTRQSTGNRMQDAAVSAVELAAVSAVASKRSRLLAQFDDRHFTPEPQAPEVLRERLTRRMAHQDFNDRYSRIDLQADRVLVKF